MSDQQDTNSTIWPFLCILACLFVLSVTSPRAWEKAAQERWQGVPMRVERQLPQFQTAQVHLGRTAVVSQISPIPCVVETPGLEWDHAGGMVAEAAGAVETEQAVEADDLFLSADPAALVAGPVNVENYPDLTDCNPITDEQSGEETHDHSLSIPAPSSDDLAVMEPALEFAPVDMPSLENASALVPSAPEGDDLAAPLLETAVETEPAEHQAEDAVGQLLAETMWRQPEALVEQLEELSWECETGPWARDVAREVRRLGRALALHSDEAPEILGRLSELYKAGEALASRLAEESAARSVRRACYALDRRVDIWTLVASVGGPSAVALRSEGDPERLEVCLADVESLVAGSPAGKAWRKYLELDLLRDLVRSGAKTAPSPLLPAEVIRRLTQAPLTSRQREFVQSEPIARLGAALRSWAGAPVPVQSLLDKLEQYEQTGLPADAQALADDCARLACSPVAEERELGNRLESSYRNANVRFTVTEALLNRFVPAREPQYERVNDCVLGNPVHGRSLTTTDLSVRMVPDPSRLHAALAIRGTVASETSSFSGPATFFSSSASGFVASKEFEFGVRGLHWWPTQVAVQNNTRLRGLATDFDPIPILGSLAHEIARSQHDEKQWQVRQEVEQKIANRVSQQIDGEADPRLAELSDRLNDRLFGPLADLSLGPAVVSAETTRERMTMRLRVASPRQLGAHTPRPMAPGDSLASVQIHESVLNNVVQRLELDGQTFTLEQLRRRIATRFNRPEMLQITSEHDEDIVLCFAPTNAVQVRCQNGQVAITLSVATLWQADNRWDNFQVQTSYRPQLDGRRAELVRDGVVCLIGEGLNMRSQIALRGIFSKTFSKQRPLVLTPDPMLEDPRLAGMGVTQLILEDGWVGLALGPERAAGESPAELHEMARSGRAAVGR